MASGGHGFDNIDHDPLVEAHVLYGAMVGGPAEDDSFEDRRSNWQQSEVALDYNALLTPLLAAQVEMGRTPFFLRL
jgi:endoglucanase